jgi:two-component system phosphate regulon response regulator PhoB|tara:strand:- start:9086 stop:9793 length:708 start_codon:yes stop_codon:yes gene_type:complete
MSSAHHILCIEDEIDIQEIIAYNLGKAGYMVTLAGDGVEGLKLAQTHIPDLILLDIMLPNLNGMQVCERLKADAKTQAIPIIMLSARSEEADVIGGLSQGADDYMTKPFSQAELLARIKVALRRRPTTHILTMGTLSLDLDTYNCSLNGQALKLTTTEFKLLHTLMAQPGRAFSREQLILSALGEKSEVVDRNVDVHIRGVRKQLGKAASAIETIRGVGYRCDPNYSETLASEVH